MQKVLEASRVHFREQYCNEGSADTLNIQIELPQDSLIVRGDALRLERVHIEITDNGAGIEPPFTEKVFDPFFTTKEAGKGTGLGLSICDGIIKDHGGDIKISSSPAELTKVTICLPLGSHWI